VAITFDVTTMAVDPPDRFVELVRIAEAAGFRHLWVCDSSLHARDVYVYLALTATNSARLRLGPNCTHPYTRHPAINLNAMATLQELSGGRAVLALGAGDRPTMELGYRIAPLAVVREMIETIRALQSGGPVSREGATFRLRHARLPVPPATPLPIYVAATGPRMLELAAAAADGVLFLSGVYPPCVEFALKHVAAGARAAGRDIAALDVGCTIYGSLRGDVAAARRECTPMAAWFPQTAPRYAEIAGVPPTTIEHIRAAYSGGHFDGATAAFPYVTDEMVARFTVAGPAEVWIERIGAVIATGVRHVNIFLLSKDRRAMLEGLAAQVLPAFTSA
jgi:5,10-methylenetetrahydromethanopterin reductase